MVALYVFLGGGLGSLARFAVGTFFPGPDFKSGALPWGTLAANLLACALLGGGLVLASRGSLDRSLQLLLLTGFCGGFSTFSTFVLELFLFAEAGRWAEAGTYLFLSLVGGVVAFGGIYLLIR